MIRLTALLCVGIYVGLIVYGKDEPTALVGKDGRPAFEPEVSRTVVADADETRRVVNPFVKESTELDAESLGKLTEIFGGAASVDPTKLVGTGAVNAIILATRGTQDPENTVFASLADGTLVPVVEPVVDDAVAEEEANPLMEVAANSVNVRSGPSTANGVIARLTRGDSARLVKDMENGWSKIRFGDTDRVGFMASKFLKLKP